jgi:hypothetical protein
MSRLIFVLPLVDEGLCASANVRVRSKRAPSRRTSFFIVEKGRRLSWTEDSRVNEWEQVKVRPGKRGIKDCFADEISIRLRAVPILREDVMMKRPVLIVLISLGLGAVARAEVAPAAAEVPRAPLPQAVKLVFEPESLSLEDGRDERGFLVWGVSKDGEKFDLTSDAKFSEDSAAIEISKEGFVHATGAGDTMVKVSAAGITGALPVKAIAGDVPAVRFVRDVLPMMSKVGCNAGTCHGSAKGKNGFKLSLRGYDPGFDYQALINDISGRRFNRVVVEESLMLLKPTAEVPHEGRQVFTVGSREYNLMRDWIREGTPAEEVSVGRAVKLEILPADISLTLPGMSQRILALAHYPDGKVRDVTRDAIFSSNNGDVAQVKGATVTSVRRGEAAILIRYEGNYATREVTVMGDRNGYQWVDVPEFNYIDKHVYAKLKKVKTLPSDLATDAEFIRRVSLDITGLPPKSERVRAFLTDTTASREKREKLVDELLGSKDYVEFWANKWADLLQCSSASLGQKAVWQYKDWIRRAVRENRPYDQFVREILLAEGNAYQNPAVNYYRVLREPEKIAEDVSQTFLGVRFNCNKCHDHPFERWTQNQYYEFAAYFSKVAIKKGYMDRDVVKDEGGGTVRVMAEEVVYRTRDQKEVIHPKSGAVMTPKAPFGNPKPASEDDRRVAFVDWLASKENPLFAKSMANRVWSYFFGLGIIDPVDDIRASNPPSNAALLDALTEEFVKSGFDTKKLIRTICTSRTYQLSFTKNDWNKDDKINFASAQPRRLSAEQMVDAVALVTGAKSKFSGLPQGMRAAEAPDAKVGDDFLTLFGRPKRQSACECERSSNLTLSHAMNLINGSTIGEAVSEPDNFVARLVSSQGDDRKVVEDLYLAILSRPPSEKETAMADLKAGGNRLEAAQDLAWALLNSPAFLFNR